MKQGLRVAVIGAGAMGRQHSAAMAAGVPGMRLVAVCDAHAETARAVGAAAGVRCFTEVADLLATRCADAVVIAVPHPLHAAAAIACVEAGLHVLCEKPLADTVGAADAMLRAARKHGVALGVMLQLRADPAVRRMLEFARGGGLGRIVRAELVVTEFRTQHYFDSNPWRATWRGEGGGVLLNQAAHRLDLFAQTAGLPASLLARNETRLHDIEVEDTAEALLRYPDGGSGYVYCSTAEAAGGGGMEIVGDLGRIILRNGRVACVRHPGGVAAFARSSTEVWGQSPTEEVFHARTGQETLLQRAVLRNFARHVLGGEPLLCDAASGLASLELANAMMLSSASGQSVSLPVDRAAVDVLLARLRAASTGKKRVVAVERVTDPKLL